MAQSGALAPRATIATESGDRARATGENVVGAIEGHRWSQRCPADARAASFFLHFQRDALSSSVILFLLVIGFGFYRPIEGLRSLV
jgi:hypothetical protein